MKFILIKLFLSLNILKCLNCESINQNDLNESTNDEVTTYNDILNFLFGTSKSEQDLTNLTNNKLNSSQSDDKNKIDFVCNPRNETNQTNQVQLITLLTKSYMPLLSESNIELVYANNECVLLLLYFSWCPHSVKIAPFYNAIGRAYPQLYVIAMDSYAHNTFNLRLSLFGVPSIVLLQNDKVISRFNESEINLTTLEDFIFKSTKFQPIHELKVIEEDFIGPVPTKIKPMFDYIMFMCIVFLIFTFCYFVRMSSIYTYLIASIRNTWLESQREHMD